MNKLSRYSEYLLPIALVACAGFAIYTYCYNYAYQRVDDRAKTAGFIVGFVVLGVLFAASWVLVLIVGPGHVERIQPDDDTREVWQCDVDGFRRWCSTCGQVKPDRAHHSGQAGRCIPKMDHYCAWLASLVGRDNFKHFVQLVMYAMLECIYIIATMLVYGHSRSTISVQMAVLYGICALWGGMMTGFFIVHLTYIIQDISTIEWLDIRRGETDIYNIPMENGQRIVIKLLPLDHKRHPMPYSQGGWQNWKRVMGPNIAYWVLPLTIRHWVKNQATPFNPSLLQELRRRFRDNEDGFLYHPRPPPPMQIEPKPPSPN